jgi:hypothetical protein
VANLCDVLNQLSLEIQQWMQAQPGVKEESLTDWLLYELSKREPAVSYKAFTRHEEAKYTGADWDWTFVFSDGVVRFRVQAKKLFANTDNYPGLARSNQYGQQIAKLINSAVHVPAYPIYAFYSELSSRTTCGGPGAPARGVYISGARRVDANLVAVRKQVSPVDAIAISYPMACIACCPNAGGSSAVNLIRQVYGYFEQEFPQPNSSDEYQGFSKQVPASISAVLRNEGRFPDWWEREFAREFEDVNAVVIVVNAD